MLALTNHLHSEYFPEEVYVFGAITNLQDVMQSPSNGWHLGKLMIWISTGNTHKKIKTK